MTHGYDTRPVRSRLDDDDDEDDDEVDTSKKAPKIADFLGKSLLENRIIMVAKPVDRELMAQITSQLLVLDQDDPKAPITMYINCPGGDADSGFGWFAVLTIVLAAAASASRHAHR